MPTSTLKFATDTSAVEDVPETETAALAELRGFQREIRLLREALGVTERRLEILCTEVTRGVALHHALREFDAPERRYDLMERLTNFESARHRMRVACFRRSLADGLSIGEISRLWGISRQLASRLVRQDPTQVEHANPMRGHG